MSDKIILSLQRDGNLWLGYWDGMFGAERLCGGCAIEEHTPTKVLEMIGANIEHHTRKADAGSS